MAKLLKLRRGTTSQHGSFTGAEGEVTVDTDKETLVVHDGSTAGGHELLRSNLSNLPANQNISTTGTVGSGNINITGTEPTLFLTDSDNNSDFSLKNHNGTFDIRDTTNNSDRFRIASVGTIASLTNHDFSAGIDVTGNITVTGTVDGRDVATDGTKLDGIEASATADQTAAEIRTLVEAASDSNVFTDNDHTKLNGIETGATADQTNSEIKTAYEANADTNAFTDADHAKLDALTTSNGVILNGVTATTQSASDNSTKVATTAYADTAVANLVDSAPGALNTLNELAAAIGDDANFSTTVTNSIAAKLPLAGGQMTGNITFSGSQTVDGRDLSADGSKLDGIESGATADQSGAEIASALGAQNIYTTGNIGRDANDYIKFTDNTRLDVYVNNNNEFRFESDGDFHADGDVVAFSTTISSDEKLKENIEIVPNALDKVEALRGVTFDWKRDGKSSAGVIAQEVMGVLPEAVKEVQGLNDNESHLTVNYHALTSILIEAIKDLSARVKQLEGK